MIIVIIEKKIYQTYQPKNHFSHKFNDLFAFNLFASDLINGSRFRVEKIKITV